VGENRLQIVMEFRQVLGRFPPLDVYISISVVFVQLFLSSFFLVFVVAGWFTDCMGTVHVINTMWMVLVSWNFIFEIVPPLLFISCFIRGANCRLLSYFTLLVSELDLFLTTLPCFHQIRSSPSSLVHV
jgi:hypothetical protein